MQLPAPLYVLIPVIKLIRHKNNILARGRLKRHIICYTNIPIILKIRYKVSIKKNCLQVKKYFIIQLFPLDILNG